MRDVDIKQTPKVEVLEEEVVEDQIVEKRLPMLEDNVVVIMNQMGEMGHQQEDPYHLKLESEIL
jgi:hypothetical protein